MLHALFARSITSRIAGMLPHWLAPAWTASIRTISALQNKHRIALNRSFINEVHGARGSLW